MFLTANKSRPAQKSRDFNEVIAALDSAGCGITRSGVHVTSETAMRQATVWACQRIISEIIAQLPIETQTRQPNGSWVEAKDHDLTALLAEPNPWQTQHDLISTLVNWSESDGNGYLFKNTNLRGEVLRLLPLESTSVTPEMLSDWAIQYTAESENGGISGTFGPDKIFHLRNFGSKGWKGLSTIGNHREGIGLAIQLEKHAVNAYKNGLQSNKWVEMERPISDPNLLAQFKSELRRFQGTSGEDSAGVPVISGAKIHELTGMSATDAQYIESRRLQKQEIASIYGVPLFLINDTEKSTTWGTGLEQLSRAFIRFSLNPRLNRLSQTFVRELVPASERRKTRVIFDTDQFTLGEFKERMDGYRSGIESGVICPDDAREIEGRGPRPDGKGGQYRIPVNIQIDGQQQEGQPNED